ncbi:Hypothetical protein CAP_1655 [Chondromyces apiculatus DSM 436]|uniref:Uncharacterized protein n=1 Tax=Chondromyces apiculatus DSM 436 TaxID=1192034 RepID=A0A017TCJ8_9BACT|nr:Hypothetical protein CAP_1655 [Chondromyces apiculatus DSM 436]
MGAERVTSERAARLFFARWLEALTTTYPAHRARTVSVGVALDEVLALADSFVRSGGVTRATADPTESGHGVAMLPDVASEAVTVLRDDPLLKRPFGVRTRVLTELVERLKAKDNVTAVLVEQLRAIVASLRDRYLEEGFAEAERLINDEPKRQGDIEKLAGALVSELRYQGWSDEGLRDVAREVCPQAASRADALQRLRLRVLVKPREFTCFVSVELQGQRLPFPEEQGLSLVDALPQGKREGRPMKDGTYLKVNIHAVDPAAAAALAHRRVLSTLGAATIFLPGTGIQVASELVAVHTDPGVLHTFEVQERLPEEKRRASSEQISKILSASWRASAAPSADPLHDAIRLRHRAMMAVDPESRLLLLWTGLERLTAGTRGYGVALSAARELTSCGGAMASGRISEREMGRSAALLWPSTTNDLRSAFPGRSPESTAPETASPTSASGPSACVTWPGMRIST